MWRNGIRTGLKIRWDSPPVRVRVPPSAPFFMKKYLAAALSLFVLNPLANAWDYTGHMLVDQVAYANVSPQVRERVGALVATLENKYNVRQPYQFVTAGAWM